MSSLRTARDVRSTFLDFFKSKSHEVVASGPLVPANDPTLMFANAGMVQFKDCFTGREVRSYKRATSSQKCIRISGKHNDLENVGRTARHHTFFEMLGNFSFGDYFKEAAILHAWELIEKYGVARDKLVVTYFKGDELVPRDDEAATLWKKISGLPDDRIIGLGRDDNFWSMGNSGPCGPCSEIHFKQGKGAADPATFGEEPGIDGVGWMEIWNLVFMQFEKFDYDEKTDVFKLKPLPAQSVDTGMGLERITSVVQGVTSNYETDLLRALVDRAAEISGKKYGGSMADDDVSMRVIADHARTTAFLIAEGIFPDRADREYVLRRVMRRAIRHGHRLGIEKPFLHLVADRVIEMMGVDYAELRDRRETILNVAESEEVRFRQTIDRGLKILDEDLAQPAVQTSKVLPGAAAFKLSDTYGFPLDLTEVICGERGFSVDEWGYKTELEAAKARSAGSKVGDAAVGDAYKAITNKVGSTEFLGYRTETARSTIVAILKGGASVEALAAGDEGELVTRHTPFYAEAGGQVGDRGEIREIGKDGAPHSIFVVRDTQKPTGAVYFHHGRLANGQLKVGQEVEVEVDHEKRAATRRNHSATHLLHFALRHVLGEHVQQKGSLVGPDRLRFDYAHGKTLTTDEIEKIEDVVNEMILANAEVKTQVMAIDEAKKSGAMAIFEEKYGDTVRVLTMDAGRYKSVELCGGTHAGRTGDIGLFRVAADKAIAAGVRRVEGFTGLNTLREARAHDRAFAPILRALAADETTALAKVEKLLADQRALEKKLSELEKKIALGQVGGGGGSSGGGIEGMLASARAFDGFKALAVRVDLPDVGAIRELADQLRDKLGESIVLVGAAIGPKAQLVLTVSKGLTSRFKAGELIRPLAAMVGGSGGGRPDMAQAGGTEVSKLDQAIGELYARFA